MFEISSKFGPVAVEILNMAQLGCNFDNFVATSLLLPLESGVSHGDRMRVFDSLVHEGCLYLEGGSFFRNMGYVPSWLIGGVADGFVDADAVATQLIETPEQRKKFDAEVLAQIGLRGEQAFVQALRDRLPKSSMVNHVSLFDDTLGYDVEVRQEGAARLCFEVKTTSKASRKFGFFLSRNEAEVALGMGNGWHLGLVQISDGTPIILGTTDFGVIHPNLPLDQSEQIRWASIKCSIGLEDVQSLDDFLSGALIQDS